MLLKKADRHTAMQIRQCYEFNWGMSMHVNEDLLAGNFVADGSSHVAYLDSSLFEDRVC